MKKIALILIVIQYFVYSATTESNVKTIPTSNISCTCLQVLNEKDCSSLQCTWDGNKCSNVPII